MDEREFTHRYFMNICIRMLMNEQNEVKKCARSHCFSPKISWQHIFDGTVLD